MGTGLTDIHRQDAPVTTSKDSGRAAVAAEEMSAPKGDSLVGKTVTINRPRQALYDYWRTLERLPQFMENVERVEPMGGNRYRWTVKAPAGRTVEWVAAVTEDRPGEVIGWTSEEGADVANSGRVEFRDAPGGRGTWVTATLLYDSPAGIVGKVIAKLFQREPAIQVRRDLRRFKQLMETGEVATGAWTRAQRAEDMN